MGKPSVVVAALVVTMVVSAVCEDRGSFVGGRSAVKDVEGNEEVQQVGRFSVKEFNRVRRERGEEGGELEFCEVVEAEVQVVAGLKYYLLVEAIQNKERKVYESEVVVQPWLHRPKHLIRFEPSKGLRVRK